MDGSGSIDSYDYKKEQDFVIALAMGFSNFGPNGIQMGVISFSTEAKLVIKLNTYSDKEAFKWGLKNIRQESKSVDFFYFDYTKRFESERSERERES